MLTLRPYQEAAKAAVYDHLRLRDDNPCVVIPTGGGKTPVMASICKDAVSLWNGRVLILAHVKELLEQSADKLQADDVARAVLPDGRPRVRLHPGKQNCLVLDFGGNVLRHGPVDAIDVSPVDSYGDGNAAPAKKCPACHSVIAAGFSICPDCEFEFPAPQRKQHAAKASDAGILSGQVTDTEYEVRDIAWSVHQKRDAPDDAPKSMRVDYRLGLSHWQSEWICIEHDGYARDKAVAWWHRRSHDPVPDTAERAVELAEAGALCQTEKIVVRSVAGERYDRIVGYKLGALPEEVPMWSDTFDEEEVPF